MPTIPAKSGTRAKILAYLSRNGLSPLADIMTGIGEPNRAKAHSNVQAALTAGLVVRERDDVTNQPAYKLTDAGREWIEANKHSGKPAPAPETPVCTKSQTAATPGAEEQAATPEVTPFDKPAPETNAPKLTEAQREEFTLLGVLADIRAAIGDPEGKIMLDELALHIKTEIAFRDRETADYQALRNALTPFTDEVMEGHGWYEFPLAIKTIDQLIAVQKAALDAHEKERDDLCARLDAVTQQSVKDIGLITEKNAKLHSEIDHLRADIASHQQSLKLLKAENLALKTLEETMPGFGAEYQAQRIKSLEAELLEARAEAFITKESPPAGRRFYAITGFILRADKRPELSRLTYKQHENAVKAATTAIRKGAKRVRLFALVPHGQVVPGAEFQFHD